MNVRTRLVLMLVAACAAISPRLPPNLLAQSPTAEVTAARAELARVQAAMGGAAELAKVSSVRISSTQNRWSSSGKPRARTETRVVTMLLPDHVLFEQQGDPRRGWAVDTPIASPGEPAASKARLKEDFAYVVLRTLLRTDTPFPLTLRAFKNGSLQYDAPNGVTVFLDIDPRTALPSRLHFTETARTNAGDPMPGRLVAHRWDLDDYRAVGNVRLAHRWTWYIEGKIQVVDQADVVELNPPLTPKDFVR